MLLGVKTNATEDVEKVNTRSPDRIVVRDEGFIPITALSPCALCRRFLFMFI